MKLKSLIWGVVILFICFNIFIVVKDKDDKIDRIAYIKDWTQTEQKDMYEKLSTKGVIDYIDEQFLFLDESSGFFQEFLVEEGDVVNVGDALYTYQVQNYNDVKSKLDSEVERLEGEITAVKASIDKMKQHNIQESSMRFVYPDGKESATIPNSTSSADIMKQQYIIDKEEELDQLEAQLARTKSQISNLTAGSELITVTSPFNGKVTKISKTLENPIITIESPQIHVIGELTEKERMKVDEGMMVDINLVEAQLENNEELQGVVHNISGEPKKVTLKGASLYPFAVTFNEEMELENLLQGYHVDLDITLQESLNTVVVNKSVVQDSAVWKMTPAGKLIKQPIEKGIHVGDLIEIKTGAESGEWITKASKERFKDQTTFITPLKTNKATWKEIFNNGPRKRSLTIGLLGR